MPAEMIDGKPDIFNDVTLKVAKYAVLTKEGPDRVDMLGELLLNKRTFVMTAQEMVHLAHLLIGCADAVERGGVTKGDN